MKILALYSRGISPQTHVQHLKPVLHKENEGLRRHQTPSVARAVIISRAQYSQ